ncbi:LacI family DNA-binding transcriptional regulator [Paracoccus sp. Z330]|uniref:LacI family DNA-binding transcriptional regulator n=1 Tax=Paracoccus onchidii TaxID=3017813 RepID=A0ABT4ZDG6_9RHOB|nr:LacI family DNA-binding transcriptional regulator [Paracoccus onchidii]MDB6177404.1 LacI family DNA-binding transcriptional regulator [Paracoccus onchidii]
MDSGNSGGARPPRTRRKMQRVTMSDVAKAAAVSPSTVSLFLRKPSAVSERIASRVQRSIDELGYVPNYVAGGLAAAGSKVVSVIVPSLRNAFFSETVAELERLLARGGLQTLVGHTEYSLDQEEALVRAALSWAPAAVVLTGCRHNAATRKLLLRSNTPVVEMWELGGQVIDQAVGFSHEQVGRHIARRFIDQGYESAAFIGARLDEDFRAAQRSEGFLAEMQEAGITARLVENSAPASTSNGVRLFEEVCMNPVRAIACSNDTLALGVLFEAQRRDLSIPTELALAGFGDLDFAAQMVPPLTTVRPAADKIARKVAECILRPQAETDRQNSPFPTEHDTGFTLVPRASG